MKVYRRSCIDALTGRPRKYGGIMQKLWESLENIMSREVDIECIWLPSHCGLPKNDAADGLDRRGILESNLLIQQVVPLALESAQSLTKPTVRNSIVRVYSLPGELTISSRRAEAVLHQLLTNCGPLVPDILHGSCGDDYIPWSPICKRCPQGVVILRGVGRAASRRKNIGRIGGNTVEELCRENFWRYSDT